MALGVVLAASQQRWRRAKLRMRVRPSVHTCRCIRHEHSHRRLSTMAGAYADLRAAQHWRVCLSCLQEYRRHIDCILYWRSKQPHTS